MAEKKKCLATVKSQSELAPGIYSLWLAFPEEYNVAAMAKPGQFLSLYSDDGSRLLPRPISICEIDAAKRMIRLVYRVAGAGTLEFSGKQEGDTIAVVGPLGNGFTPRSGKSILIGGGIGIPPMLALAKSLSGEVQVVLGYRDAVQFLKEDFAPYASVYVSTEDGSVGTKGNVIDAIRAEVWAYADAAWCKSICGRAGDRSSDFFGRAYGVWYRCLLRLCMHNQRKRCTQSRQ